MMHNHTHWKEDGARVREIIQVGGVISDANVVTPCLASAASLGIYESVSSDRKMQKQDNLCLSNTNWELLLHYWGNFTLSQPPSIIQKVHRGSTPGMILGSFTGDIFLGEFLTSLVWGYLIQGR